MNPNEESNISKRNGLSSKWKKRGFLIITLVRKFVLKMQNLSFIRRFHNQTSHQFKVINDLSAHYDEHMKGKIYKSRGLFKQIIIQMK